MGADCDCIGCGSAAVTERPDLTAQGYRRFRCRDCGRQSNERSGSVLNRASLPSDIIVFVVFCRLRYRLTLGDLSEIMLLRTFTVSYKCVRQWEAKLLPVIGEALRKRLHARDAVLARVGMSTKVRYELGVSRGTVYRLIGRYRATRTGDGLCGPGRGRRERARFLSEAEETPDRRHHRTGISQAHQAALSTCARTHCACLPSAWVARAATCCTFKARLSLVDQRVRAVRRGNARAIRSLDATPGEYTATRPLEVVQIDHTQVDVSWSTNGAGKRWGGRGSPSRWMC